MADLAEIQFLAKRKKEIIDNCPECHGRDLGCACYKSYRVELRKMDSGMPRKFWNYQLPDPKTVSLDRLRVVLGKLQAYTIDLKANLENGVGLFMYGPSGTGKSALACSILCKYFELGATGTFQEFERYITTSLHSREDYRIYDEIKTDLHEVPILVLDNIGYEGVQSIKWMAATIATNFEALLRHRSNFLKPTIITTSHEDLKFFAQAYGECVLSLLTEKNVLLNMTGLPDFRKENGCAQKKTTIKSK